MIFFAFVFSLLLLNL